MTLRRLLTFATAALLLGTSSKSFAIPITVPTELNPGDEYRLVFVTSWTQVLDATSTNIADYNAFVTGVANSVAELAALGTTWTVIASTATVDARDNTGTNPSSTGVPIYRLNNTLLATGNADLWDGSIQNPLNINAEGNLQNSITVWSGTGSSGIALNPLGGATSHLAAPNATNADWIDGFGVFSGTSSSRSFYVMSGVLTAPEPSTASLLCLGLVGIAALRRRRAP